MFPTYRSQRTRSSCRTMESLCCRRKNPTRTRFMRLVRRRVIRARRGRCSFTRAIMMRMPRIRSNSTICRHLPAISARNGSRNTFQPITCPSKASVRRTNQMSALTKARAPLNPPLSLKKAINRIFSEITSNRVTWCLAVAWSRKKPMARQTRSRMSRMRVRTRKRSSSMALMESCTCRR